MEEFKYIQVSIDLKLKQASGLVPKCFSLKTIKDNSVNAFKYPFADIFLTFTTDSNTQFFLYYEQTLAAELEIPSNLVLDKTQSCLMNIASSFFSKLDHASLSVQLKKTESLHVPENVIKKYKEDLQDTSHLIKLLAQTLEDPPAETGPEAYHDLAVDLDLLTSTEPVTNQQTESLKELILGLNQKLKVLSSVEIMLETTTQNCVKNLRSRELMHEDHMKTLKKVSEIKAQHQKELKKQHEINNSTQEKLDKSERNNRELSKVIDQLNGDIHMLSSEKKNLESRLKNFEAVELSIRQLQKNIEDLEISREKLREKFVEFQKNCDLLDKKKDKEFSEVVNKNTELEEVIRAKNSEIFELKTIISDRNSVISKQNSEITSFLAEIKGFKDQDSKAATMEALAKKHQQECVKSHENMQKTTAKFSDVLKNVNQEKQKILKTNAELVLKTTDLSEKIRVIEEKLSQESTKIQDLRSENKKMKSLLDLNENFYNISQTLLKLFSDFSKAKLKFTSDFGVFFKVFMELSFDFMNALRYLEKLKEIVFEKDEEILVLKEINVELQRRVPYLAVKDDPVDLAMAEYVNSLENPLDVPFIREEQGIYIFGTKRIYVKVDNGKLSSNS